MDIDFEDWEPDYDLCMREDWPGLVRYREQVARRASDDLYAQGRLGEAYVLSGEYERAIEFLSELYHKHPYFTDAEHYLLDALFALSKSENDFDWVTKPIVFRMSDELLDMCYSRL
jgi:tetratricopeptide (TPR) repeat protein